MGLLVENCDISKPVISVNVSCAYVFCRREDCQLSDPSLLTVILPSPENIPDKTQAKLTSDILQNLGAGLEVRVNGNIVYGSRHGDSKIFWGVDKHEQTGIPRELAKQEPEAIFSLENFINGEISKLT